MQSLLTKTDATRWSHAGLQDYFLVAYPDAGVNEKVLAEKQQFTGSYLDKLCCKTLPGITIASFAAREEMEDTIIRYTHRICSRHPGFNVELNNYSGLPSGSIFLRIQNPQPFKVFAKELEVISHYIKTCSCPPIKLYENPHLLIASQLPDHLYLKAMMDYSQKTFHETFMVNELVMLKRNNQYDTCKTVQVFRLQPPGFNPFKTVSNSINSQL